ncbi:DUF1275 family protein [Streptomyces sp. RPT161]|uniref:DUF1275 family protein n=1 Tax=Streptomyces sp. RPT161 TaxID=3015993 RepID=UPI003FCC50F9
MLAVAGFAAGVATAGAAFRVAPGCRRWLFSALAVEISLLAVTTAVAFLAPDSRMGRNACVVLLSTTMGIRCAVIRRIGVPELRATFAFTGALVALVHDACAGTGAHASRRFGIIAAMTFGAAVGAATVIRRGVRRGRAEPWSRALDVHAGASVMEVAPGQFRPATARAGGLASSLLGRLPSSGRPARSQRETAVASV